MWKHLGSLVKGVSVSNAIATLLHRGVHLTRQDLAYVCNEHFVDLAGSVDGSDSCKCIQRRN